MLSQNKSRESASFLKMCMQSTVVLYAFLMALGGSNPDTWIIQQIKSRSLNNPLSTKHAVSLLPNSITFTSLSCLLKKDRRVPLSTTLEIIIFSHPWVPRAKVVTPCDHVVTAQLFFFRLKTEFFWSFYEWVCTAHAPRQACMCTSTPLTQYSSRRQFRNIPWLTVAGCHQET